MSHNLLLCNLNLLLFSIFYCSTRDEIEGLCMLGKYLPLSHTHSTYLLFFAVMGVEPMGAIQLSYISIAFYFLF